MVYSWQPNTSDGLHLILPGASDFIPVNGREDFLTMRRGGVGASDIAAILGESKYKTPHDVYLSKTATVDEETSQDEPERLKWGNRAEPMLRAGFHDDYPHDIDVIDTTSFITVSNRSEYSRASLDGLVLLRETGEYCVLQLKTSDRFAFARWQVDPETGKRIPPLDYVLQVQFELAVSGLSRAFLYVLVGGNEAHYFEITADPELGTFLIEQADDFYRTHVLGDNPPDDERYLLEVYSQAHVPKGSQKEATPEEASAARELAELKGAKKQLDEEIARLEKEVKLAIGEDAEELVFDGQTLATWKSVTSRRFDSAEFKKNEPELYERYRKESTSRRFTVSGVE